MISQKNIDFAVEMYKKPEVRIIDVANKIGVSFSHIQVIFQKLGIHKQRLYLEESNIKHSKTSKERYRLGLTTPWNKNLKYDYKPKKISMDEVQEVIRMYTQDKMSTYKIAQIISYTPYGVWHILKRNNVPINQYPEQYTPEVRKKMRDSKINGLKSGRIQISGCAKESHLHPENGRGIKGTFYGRLHSQISKENNSLSHIHLWKDEEYRTNQLSEGNIKKRLKGLIKRPTSYEKKISELCIDYGLPFIYTGDGTFLIGHKNPDFVCQDKKIAIEVYHKYFKEKVFGSCEIYERDRTKYFNERGWKVIFINEEHILAKNWQEQCLKRIDDIVIGGNNE